MLAEDVVLKTTVVPPIPPLSGLAKKRRYWKAALKGVVYNQEKTYSGLEISGGIGGGGGGDCISTKLYLARSFYVHVTYRKRFITYSDHKIAMIAFECPASPWCYIRLKGHSRRVRNSV